MRRTLAVAFVVALSVAVPLKAAEVFVADLNNASEFPPTNPTLSAANGGGPRPASFGTATFVLNDTATAMTMQATVFNIDFTGTQTPDPNDNLTVAHIHASPTASLGNTAGVVWGFIGTPFNDNNPNDVVVTPFATGVGGTVTAKWDAPEGNNTTLAAQLSNIRTGHAYINFHTTQFGGGEIRGFLTAVPVPAAVWTALSVMLPLGVFGVWRRRTAIS